MATIKKACKGVSYPKSSSVSKRLGSPSKAKNGKSFPDLNKDGKITKADILKGRGVIAKKGIKVKKAQEGIIKKPSSGALARFEKAKAQAPVRKGASSTPIFGIRDRMRKGMMEIQGEKGGENITQEGLDRMKAAKPYYKKGGAVKKSMKTGGKMTKKCMYGCK